MKKFVTSVGVSVMAVLLVCGGTASALIALPQYGATVVTISDPSSSSAPQTVATDTAGNQITAGFFNGTVNFAGTAGNDTVTTTYGTAYVTKYNHNGTYGWTRTVDNSNGYAQFNSVVADASGNIYALGVFGGQVALDGPGGSNVQNISSGNAGFIIKYSASGAYQWSKVYSTQPNMTVSARGIVLDGSGNLYFSGDFEGSVDFAAPEGGSDVKTTPNRASFLSRINANGTYGWTRIFDTSNGSSSTSGLAITSAGALYMSGSYADTVGFSSTDTQNDGGNYGGSFLTKFMADGSYGWTRTYNNADTNSYVQATGVAADDNGNVYETGYLYGSSNFAGAGGSDTHTDAGGQGDTYLVRYQSNGSYGWTRTFDTSAGGSAYGQSVAVDPVGGVYVLSGYSGPVNFAGTAGSDVHNESNAGALTAYTTDGTYAWTRVFSPQSGGNAVLTQGTAGGVATDLLGNAYVASVFAGTVTFDGPAGSDSQTAGGYGAGFLTRYRTFDPVVSAPSQSTLVSAQSGSGSPATVKVPNTGFAQEAGSASFRFITLVSVGILLLASIGVQRFLYRHRKSVPETIQI